MKRMPVITVASVTILTAGLLYVGSFLLIRWIKPPALTNNDEPVEWYRRFYLPLRWLSVENRLGLPHDTMLRVTFRGSNGVHDRVFFEFDGKDYGLYLSINNHSAVNVDQLQLGSGIKVRLSVKLTTADDFVDYLHYEIQEIATVEPP
jgi:hypothetical protein